MDFMNFVFIKRELNCGFLSNENVWREQEQEIIIIYFNFSPEENFYLRNAARRVTYGSTAEQNGSIFPDDFNYFSYYFRCFKNENGNENDIKIWWSDGQVARRLKL